MASWEEKMKVFIDVDTQVDFMNEDGALYVLNAELIKASLSKLTEHALKNGITILATGDCHLEEDAELSRNGGLFPNHCMKDTYGATKISETLFQLNEGALFSKRCYDIFDEELGSIGFVNFLKEKNVTDAIVYGVATDYCIKAAVLGLLRMGISVTVVKDAIKGVEEISTTKALYEMKMAGAVFCETKDVTKCG